jgi:hypothetical protein
MDCLRRVECVRRFERRLGLPSGNVSGFSESGPCATSRVGETLGTAWGRA